MMAGVDWRTLNQFRFGDSPALADRLAALVVAGVKTATCSSASLGVEACVGQKQVVLSGDGLPVAVIETLTLDMLALVDITADRAALEGEGDLSHAYWLDAHRDYFQREGTYTPDMPVIFETFRLVAVLDSDFAGRVAEHVAAERAEAFAAGYNALGAIE